MVPDTHIKEMQTNSKEHCTDHFISERHMLQPRALCILPSIWLCYSYTLLSGGSRGGAAQAAAPPIGLE
jgi:hypothetical protein